MESEFLQNWTQDIIFSYAYFHISIAEISHIYSRWISLAVSVTGPFLWSGSSYQNLQRCEPANTAGLWCHVVTRLWKIKSSIWFWSGVQSLGKLSILAVCSQVCRKPSLQSQQMNDLEVCFHIFQGRKFWGGQTSENAQLWGKTIYSRFVSAKKYQLLLFFYKVNIHCKAFSARVCLWLCDSTVLSILGPLGTVVIQIISEKFLNCTPQYVTARYVLLWR